MLSERPMDWTHRLFNRARSSRSQTLTDNQTVRLFSPFYQPRPQRGMSSCVASAPALSQAGVCFSVTHKSCFYLTLYERLGGLTRPLLARPGQGRFPCWAAPRGGSPRTARPPPRRAVCSACAHGTSSISSIVIVPPATSMTIEDIDPCWPAPGRPFYVLRYAK